MSNHPQDILHSIEEELTTNGAHEVRQAIATGDRKRALKVLAGVSAGLMLLASNPAVAESGVQSNVQAALEQNEKAIATVETQAPDTWAKATQRSGVKLFQEHKKAAKKAPALVKGSGTKGAIEALSSMKSILGL